MAAVDAEDKAVFDSLDKEAKEFDKVHFPTIRTTLTSTARSDF